MNQAPGFVHDVSDEALERWLVLTAEDRLVWLEQAQIFAYDASPPEIREKREKMRDEPRV